MLLLKGTSLHLFSALLLFGAGLLFAQNISIPAIYDQSYRPQYHFSPREHWTNDPNGLVHFEGEYHLFFQYNPFGDQWGHMTWGHAVSRDLLHWQELSPAIPEENGIMIFTGSTVIDEHNSSGFCQGGKPCMVAIYTGHTPEANGKPALQTQNLAYSNDRGRTWTKYVGNPVLDLHMSDFRDPKVFWYAQGGHWAMVVSLPNEHKVRLYRSADMKHWEASSDFGPAGATDGQWECPELFELPFEGGHGKTKWILKIGLNPGALQGGSGEQYFIGQFDGRRFVNDNPPAQTMWTDYGKDCYCALTFNHLPHGERPVMLGWMNNWQYAKDLPTNPWRGQMTFPRTLSLRQTSDGLRLFQLPASQLEQLQRTSQRVGSTGTVQSVNQWLLQSGLAKSRSFQLRSDIVLGSAEEVGLRILQGEGKYTVVGYNRKRERLFFDRTHSGIVSFSKDFPDRTEAPLSIPAGTLRLDILVDRNSVEVFAAQGQIASTNLVFPPANASGLELYAEGGQPGQVSASVTPIQSIWAGSK